MGFLARSGAASFAPTAAVVTAATLAGASLLYAASRHGGRPLLARLGRRFGWTEARAARVEGWLARRGAAAVVVGRLIPGLRIVMTVVAGALRLPQRTFALGTLAAGLIWATLYFWLGWFLGAGYERLSGGPAPRWAPVAIALGIAGVLGAALWLHRRLRQCAGSVERGPEGPDARR
jgi:membrane protein DedA with SNARE-associated domain